MWYFGSMSVPDVGDRAPDIDLPSTLGPFNLYEWLKKDAVLLVFYPRDKSLICTRQLCNYRDHVSRFVGLGVQLAGINHDSLESHESFARRYDISFPLVSDSMQTACRAYGALLDLWKMRRLLVLVGIDGRIKWRHAELSLFYTRAGKLHDVIEQLQRDRRASSP